MVIAKIKVDGVTAVATELSQIPKGIQGATIEVTYDGAWGSLNKTAVFSGSVVKDVVNVGAVISVPPETVAKSGHRLRVGFYGVDGENKMIIPTLWIDLGAIQSAADPSGDASTNPSLPVWAQLQAEVEALKKTGVGTGTGATAEQAAQIAQNKEDIEKLSREKLDASKLPEAVKESVDAFGAVSYNKQTLTEEQKAQARENIGIPDIVCPVSGDVIAVTDSLNQKLRGLNLFGKTTQNGTPTPDSPVELESVGDDGSILVSVTDGTDENVQTLLVPTPNGLPGIPVTAGGNYTDENGQQWICDEIDFARGKYVHRVWNALFDGSADEVIDYTANDASPAGGWARVKLPYNSIFSTSQKPNLLCSHFVPAINSMYNLSDGVCTIAGDGQRLTMASKRFTNESTVRAWLKANPLYTVYELATTFETDLTAEEIAQYSVLYTNYPNTTIYNDEGAGMSVKYIADTKLYIDNKFSELQNAILSAGANV